MIDNPWILFAALPLAAYVIGSTPVGMIIAHYHNTDLRAKGSGNVGATNVGRVIGRKWGFLCFYLDVAKGFIPVLVASVLVRGDSADLPTATQQASMLGVAFGAIAGHVLSFWLKFRGGKGVATSLGVVLGVFPYFTYPGLCAFAIWIAVTLTTRYVSLGSIVAAGAQAWQRPHQVSTPPRSFSESPPLSVQLSFSSPASAASRVRLLPLLALMYFAAGPNLSY